MQISQIKIRVHIEKKKHFTPHVCTITLGDRTQQQLLPKSVSHTHASDSVSILVRYSYDRIRVMFNLTKKEEQEKEIYRSGDY